MPSSTHVPIAVEVGPQQRLPPGVPPQVTVAFKAQEIRASFAWGSSPGSATVVYVPPSNTAWSLAEGSDVRITVGANYFAGICKSDTEVRGSGGHTRTLEFIDYRDYLQWDFVFGAFNLPDVRLVNGVRQKRWKHMYPQGYQSWSWTFTNAPLRGFEILEAIFADTNPTIGTLWDWDLTGNGQFPAGVLNVPVYGLEFLGGKRLDSLLNEIGEKTGVVFTHDPTTAEPFRLQWTVKGYGVLPPWASKSDERRIGTALSGNATNICVLGARNMYQVLDMPMVADWAAAWEQFVVFETFAEDIYQRDKDPLTGVAFKATPNDPEQYIGRQKANARALEITLKEYVALRNDEAFADNRKFAGRSRMGMPCALYIQTLLFKAFKPNLTSFVNAKGLAVPLTSIDIADRLLCRVTHDPSTGEMTAFPNEAVDGNGYAIVKGYQVGADLFRTIKPDQWNTAFFADATKAWATAPFQIDDSGEGVRFIIFDQPVIVADNLLVAAGQGNVALNAGFTLKVPQVRAALTLEAEPFQEWQGTFPNVSRDRVENAAGLNAEYVVKNGASTEILYNDGKTGRQKAVEIALSLLTSQYAVTEGGSKVVWDGVSDPAQFGTRLSSMVDRVQVVLGPGGFYNMVDFTNERQRDHFEPERELDRRTIQNTLYPGQNDLRQRAQDARNLASAFKQMPWVQKLLSALLSGKLGAEAPLQLTWFASAPGGSKLNVGTPIWKKPALPGQGTGPNTQTLPTFTAGVTSAETVFVGVTTRHQEDATKPFYAQTSGPALARVLGPISVGDVVGKGASGNDYLIKDGTPKVGVAAQAIVTIATVLPIQVTLGTGGGGDVLPVWL